MLLVDDLASIEIFPVVIGRPQETGQPLAELQQRCHKALRILMATLISDNFTSHRRRVAEGRMQLFHGDTHYRRAK